MSTVFSKNKEKCSRSSSNEANNSFVKNVTSRVSGLLPATITRWFSSPSSSAANGSTPTADATDSSTEDEASESPITTQPPSKRMRYSSPVKFNHYGQAEASQCVTSNIDTLEQCTSYSTIQSPPGRTTFRRETNYISTPVRPSSEESIIDRNERDNLSMLKTQNTISGTGTSVAQQRKSIFDSMYRKEESMKACARTARNVIVDPKAPCFKPSLFGSPFYPGQTKYGGASSTYINQPNIKQRKVALVNESTKNDSLAMSQSARRVLDLLENYSSPLMEAKRIAPYLNIPKSEHTTNASTSGSPYVQKVISYKTQELHVPTKATILRLKQRSRLMETTNAARQIIASHSSTAEYLPYPSSNNTKKDQAGKETSDKFTTKVKSRLTISKRGDSMELEDQIVTPVNLPTGVLLIDKDNLPKFTFGCPASNVSSMSTNKFTSTTTSIVKPDPIDKILGDPLLSKPTLNKPEIVTTIDPYKFSSPVRISSETPQFPTTPHKFVFGSPERGIDKPKVEQENDYNSSCVVGTPKHSEKIVIPKTNDWKCPDCWVSNTGDVRNCVCCGGTQPKEGTPKVSKCSVCKVADIQSLSDKCFYCENVQTNNLDKIIRSKPTNSAKWKCDDCWVDNDDHMEKCACCGAKKPTKAIVSEKTTEAPKSTSPSCFDNDWKCEDCWIKNKSDVNKCAACGGTRPGAKQNSTSTLPKNPFGSSLFHSTNKTMITIVEKQKETWECHSCLVRNENNISKCVCCDSDKPGTIKEYDKKTFDFDSNPNPTFKFGVDVKVQQTSSTKSLTEKPVELMKKADESEKNNNILPKTLSFTFGNSSKKPEDQTVTAEKTGTYEVPKVNFTFGIPKSEVSAASANTQIFGSSSNKLLEISNKVTEEKEKPQEVPKIEILSSGSNVTPKTITGLFGSAINSQVNDKPAATTMLNPISFIATKDLTSDSLKLQLSAKPNSDEAQSQSTFTFSTNLFSMPAATTASSSSTTPLTATTIAASSLFQKPEASEVSTPLLYPNTETVTMSTVPQFQQTESTTIGTAPRTLGGTAPIFSFGNSAPQITQSSVTQPEKAKFNFTFGNNTASMFNNSFGSDTNANNNKFSLGGNSLSGSGNGLSAANPIGGGNSLVSNKLAGNSEITSNSLIGSNEIQTTNVFGAPVQKENMWSAPSNNTSNMFVSNTPSNQMQKPATFTFGSNSNNLQFNASNAPAPASPFGNNAAPPQNVFGMNPIGQPSIFASPTQNQAVPTLFGNPQPANPAPSIGMFGSPNVGAPTSFGVPNQTVPSFEAPSHAPASNAGFNFNNSMQTQGIFGFGQSPQQPQQQPQQAGVYSFGAAAGAPQVQFSMGSAPSTSVRRVRKAVRRNPQR